MNALKLIQLGNSGPEVQEWQYFLIGQKLFDGIADGEFGQKTLDATIRFQKLNTLEPDGIVGNKTYGAALLLGLNAVEDTRTGIASNSWPPKPDFLPLVTNAQRQSVFGKFTFIPEPLPNDPEHIKITDSWQKDNIISVHIPQLQNIPGGKNLQFHKLVAPQLIKLFNDWEQAGLIALVLGFEGAFDSRFIRGSRTTLSNHSFGSAFDINEPWNKFQTQPALAGQKGSVRELVELANKNGFYWGGHFTNPDGMHFEIAKIL